MALARSLLRLGSLWVAVVSIVAVIPAGEVAAQARSSMEEELARQQQLLDLVGSGDVSGADGLSTAQPARRVETDARAAPAAPRLRELPLVIFDREVVEIQAKLWGNDRKMRLERRSLDGDRDGVPELVRYVDTESKLVIRQEEDRNYDGVTDAWTDYEWGAPVARELDTNDDGNRDVWETYQAGRMVLREVDRNDDGVRDASFRYEGGSLVEEWHDANDDGKLDLTIAYQDRYRVNASEDIDRDGRIDTWTYYIVRDGDEVVARIERDKRGRGFADTFDTFEPRDGKAILAKREEDVNGDRKIDIVSIYRDGKLIRRELSDPSLASM